MSINSRSAAGWAWSKVQATPPAPPPLGTRRVTRQRRRVGGGRWAFVVNYFGAVRVEIECDSGPDVIVTIDHPLRGTRIRFHEIENGRRKRVVWGFVGFTRNAIVWPRMKLRPSRRFHYLPNRAKSKVIQPSAVTLERIR